MSRTAEPASERVRLRRHHERAQYDGPSVAAILDAMPLCHIGYVHEGTPYVTPTLQWREGDRVYWHGSSASRMIRAALRGEVCLTVTCLDGLVLARSAFHHSVNYRSVMVIGQAEEVVGDAAKAARLEIFLDHLVPGRWPELRPLTAQELKATAVVSLPLTEASAKVRTGPPKDAEADYALPIWAGVLPFAMAPGTPEPDPRNLPEVALPDHLGRIRLG